MNVEKTIEFILEQQAKTAEQQATFEVRLARLDRRVDAIAKIVQTGMRMLVRNEAQIKSLIEAQKKTDLRINALAKAQEKTDKRFDRLIEILAARSKNGNR